MIIADRSFGTYLRPAQFKENCCAFNLSATELAFIKLFSKLIFIHFLQKLEREKYQNN
jgi:hypothetical protein